METGAGEGKESFPLPGYIVCLDIALQGLRTRPAGEKSAGQSLRQENKDSCGIGLGRLTCGLVCVSYLG